MTFGLFVMGLGFALSQTLQNGTLTISGRSGEAQVVHMGGRSYVDVEELARITKGSLSFNGNQIILTLPVPDGSPGTPEPPAAQGFSKDFLRTAIEAGAEIREWRSALESAVQYGFPPGDTWINRYSGAASTALSRASASASTDDDRKGVQLLNSVFKNLQSLSNQMLSARKNMNYIAPNALQNDPLDQKIVACGQALHAMAAAGRYQEARECY
jgi:hypothetical protein